MFLARLRTKSAIKSTSSAGANAKIRLALKLVATVSSTVYTA